MGNRPGDPRNHRRYRVFKDHMRATLPPLCGRCRNPIDPTLHHLHPWSWTWGHHPITVEQIMRTLPRHQWVTAATDPTGGRPEHRHCNIAQGNKQRQSHRHPQRRTPINRGTISVDPTNI